MPDTDETVYFDAVLSPNQSLSERGFAWLMVLVGAVSFVTGMAFLSMGALPVLGFFGLDALAIWLAFRWSFRAQQQQTRIRVTASKLTMHHRNAKGVERLVDLPAGFTRVELGESGHQDPDLRIEHGRTGYVIGRFLTAGERASLARALKVAAAERHPV